MEPAVLQLADQRDFRLREHIGKAGDGVIRKPLRVVECHNNGIIVLPVGVLLHPAVKASNDCILTEAVGIRRACKLAGAEDILSFLIIKDVSAATVFKEDFLDKTGVASEIIREAPSDKHRGKRLGERVVVGLPPDVFPAL